MEAIVTAVVMLRWVEGQEQPGLRLGAG